MPTIACHADSYWVILSHFGVLFDHLKSGHQRSLYLNHLHSKLLCDAAIEVAISPILTKATRPIKATGTWMKAQGLQVLPEMHTAQPILPLCQVAGHVHVVTFTIGQNWMGWLQHCAPQF